MKSPVPIPPRFPRSSVICVILIALLAGLWIIGDKRAHYLRYVWQNRLPPTTSLPSTPPNTPSTEVWHGLEICDAGISTSSGILRFTTTKYESFDPDLDALLARWKDQRGWQHSGSGYKLSTRQNPFANARSVEGGFQILGCGVVQTSTQGERTNALIIPILYPMLLLSIPVIVALRRRSRYVKRLRAGKCLHCGYALAGVSICPECGTPVNREEGT